MDDLYEDLRARMTSLEARVAALETGGATPMAQTVAPRDETDATGIVQVQVTNKRYDAGHLQQHIWFDCRFTAVGLAQPTRAVKGTLEFCDLFGAPEFMIGYTITDRLEPGGSVTMTGIGFEHNRFLPPHQWMLGTQLEDMTVRFRVAQLLYEDGTAETL